ncbi:MAG: hypothetical protein GWM87_06960 [Xanthomonadales bacterium]|nr:hypothetical protein [Xanthomonadales bacterium]NIX12699.1 hypothetical protein [Xanthomonadales bacterium]
MQLNIKAFALACGILWSAALFLVTWWVIVLEGSSGNPTWIGSIYIGYNISPLGSIIGAAWGFVDGLIGGAVLAWLYNKLAGGK